jgi:hypothetical protein
MNAERHIRKMNRILAEIGENPPYRWIYSESSEFKRAMRVINEDGSLAYAYRCPCGVNVSVHSPECIAGQLIVAEPVYEIRKTDLDLVDQWVLCCLQIPMSEYEWRETFGTRLPYPQNGTWAPVQTETRTVAMPPGTLPGENFTIACVRGRQRSREIPMCDLVNAQESREQRKEDRRKKNIRERLTDVLPVNPNPGARGGSVLVFSEPPQKTGENLVTL